MSTKKVKTNQVTEKKQVRTCANGHSWTITKVIELRGGMSHSHTEGGIMCPQCKCVAVSSEDVE